MKTDPPQASSLSDPGSPGVSRFQAPAIPDHELLRKIGGGSYGEVWLARNILGELRAVKVVHRNSFEDDRPFQREFEGIQRFEPISRSHPSQLAILHVGRNEAGGYFYYVMELADDAKADAGCQMPDASSQSGGAQRENPVSGIQHSASYSPHTLRHDLRTRTPLSSDECVKIGLALAEALGHLHQHGLVHRDIKPSNIIFVGGVPKLADIGLVTDVDASRSFVGTEGYLPPEGPGTPQADLYGLGKVLYELCTGKDRKEYPALPPDLRERPENEQRELLELNAVLVKACATEPRQRYQTAEELHADLALLQRGQSVKRHRLWQRRWAVAKVLGLLMMAVTLLATALVSWKGSKPGHTPSPEALELYKEGQWQYSQLTPEAHVKAHTYLTQAVQVDPSFVQPYGEMMALYTWLMIPGITNEQIRLQKVREIADKALAIDPNSVEGHTALSFCRFLERDWHGAEGEIQRAIQVNPNFALAHDIYCFYLSMQGRTKEAHLEGQRAVELRPPDSRRATAIIASWPFMAERRFDLAIVQLQRVMELDPKFSFGLTYLGSCYLAQSNFVAAIDTFKTCALQSAADSDRVLAIFRALRGAYDTQGEQGYFRKWIELMLAEDLLPEEERVLSDNVGPTLAGAYARLGETDKALKELEDHFDEPQIWHQIKFIPEYDTLYDEPRFIALVKRAGLEP